MYDENEYEYKTRKVKAFFKRAIIWVYGFISVDEPESSQTTCFLHDRIETLCEMSLDFLLTLFTFGRSDAV